MRVLKRPSNRRRSILFTIASTPSHALHQSPLTPHFKIHNPKSQPEPMRQSPNLHSPFSPSLSQTHRTTRPNITSHQARYALCLSDLSALHHPRASNNR
ncbi:hypothetical protein K491DRAFT_696141 [Lophiostoma macrostomum CBS 122681]|uniref:Uncharacterized protein n=1 Tax=Lophiostoma macrostomum CBS 122681 TaxID=1314788 RepID=A0A6A6SZ36_9PLEO|nr:hypothetical protein K491DRAFT_696141 [Lophiostoma macrostomum CBS 122681]